MFKNVASQSIALFAFDITTGAPKTGDSANMVFYITKDWGSVTAISASSGVPTEMDSTNAKGWYKIAVSQTETNADEVVLTGKSSTSNVSVVGREISTLPAAMAAVAGAAGGLFIAGTNAPVTITGSGAALTLSSSGSNGAGLNIAGNGSGAAILATGGATGHGISAVGGATSGDGISAAASTSGHGVTATGVGTTKHGVNATGGATTSHGISATGGATSGSGISAVAAASGSGIVATGAGTTKPGIIATGGATTSAGLSLVGGGTSGAGLLVTTTSGDGLTITPTAGHGINVAANGTSKHGMFLTGGTAGTSDGLSAVAGSGGVDIRGAITGNITGNLSGSAGSVSGAVGSVTGNVGGNVVGTVASVVGAVGSVTGNVGGNVVGTVASVVGNVGGNVTGSVGSIATGGITNASLAADTGLKPIRSNTAQAGSGTTITLDASANAADSFYNNDIVYITGGTGVGQARFISAYVGATKVATVSTWVTNPDNTSTFSILPFDAVAGASAPTAAQVATAVWQDTTSGDFTVSGSIGKGLFTSGAVPGAAGGVFIAGTNAATSITTALTANVIGNITGNLSGSVGSVTAGVTVTTNNDKTGYALTSAYDYAKGTVAMTEAYAANGVAPTPIQATYAIHQMLMDFAITSTSYTVKKLDNSTTAFVGTLDSATAPTSLVRT